MRKNFLIVVLVLPLLMILGFSFKKNSHNKKSNTKPQQVEVCSVCKKKLYPPSTRTCTWCAKRFNGWGYYTYEGQIHYENEVVFSSFIRCNPPDKELYVFGVPVGYLEIHNYRQYGTSTHVVCSKHCAYEEIASGVENDCDL